MTETTIPYFANGNRNTPLTYRMPFSEIEEKRRVLPVIFPSSWDPEIIYALSDGLAYRLEKQ